MIYLDNAATTLRKPECVVKAVTEALTTLGNASRGAHGSSLDSNRVIYKARSRAAIPKYFFIRQSFCCQIVNASINGSSPIR